LRSVNSSSSFPGRPGASVGSSSPAAGRRRGAEGGAEAAECTGGMVRRCGGRGGGALSSGLSVARGKRIHCTSASRFKGSSSSEGAASWSSCGGACEGLRLHSG